MKRFAILALLLSLGSLAGACQSRDLPLPGRGPNQPGIVPRPSPGGVR